MSRIFITGATGFIGSHIAYHLSKTSHELKLLVRPNSHNNIPSRIPLPENAEIITGDLCKPDTYQDALQATDIVIHLAADYRVGLPNTKKARQAMYQTNVEGTLMLAKASVEAKVQRFIYASSTAAFGETHYEYPNEMSQHNGVFRCYYEETKHIAHQLLLQQKSLPLTMAILGGVFGQGDNSSLTLAMKDFIQGKLKVQPDNTSRFQLCHIDDIVNAFTLLIEHANPDKLYLFTGKDYSMPEIFSMLAEIAQKKEPKKIGIKQLKIPAYIMGFLSKFGFTFPLSKEILNIMDGSTYMYSSQKAEKTLGWKASDTDENLKKYMALLMVEQ